jgi:predicted RND superfamily exporter protein
MDQRMRKPFFQRYGLLIILASALSAAVAGVGAAKALGKSANNPFDWIPASMPEARLYYWFREHFGGDEILVVSWPGCSFDDVRLDALAAALLPAGGGGAAPPDGALFRQVFTGPGVLRRLTSVPLNLSREEALRRMSGWLVGPDGVTSAAILVVSEAGAADRAVAIEAVRRVARERCGIAEAQIHLGGPTNDCVAIDHECYRVLYHLTAFAVLAGIVFCLVSLRSARLTAIVFATAALSEAWSTAMIYWFGLRLDSVLIMMPGMVYILTVSCCIHQLNYYLDELEHAGPTGAGARSLARSWQPALAANGTAAFGLASLAVSGLAPIRHFGVLAALGVLVSLVFVFLLLTAVLEVCRPVGAGPRRRAAPHAEGGRPWNLRIAVGSVVGHRWILGVVAVLVPVLGFGLARVRTSVKLQTMFMSESRVMQDYRWLERNLGPLVPVETVLRFGPGSPGSMLERLELVDHLERAIGRLDGVGVPLSAATFMPAIPDAGSWTGRLRRRLFEARLAAARPQLQDAGFLARGERGEELWRISSRTEALNDTDSSEILGRIRGVIEPIIAARAPGHEVKVEYTGAIPVVAMVQRQLMEDLVTSFGTAALGIALVLILSLRRFLGGLITMIPNLFPILLVFGVMGWLRIVVDLGSMMTISTALGIAVDNELHFFSWFREGLERGLSRREALLATYQHCGAAMVQSALICGLGMLIFTFSPFVPTKRFGWLMFSLMVLAVASDLILLPALLASPLGYCFGRPKALAPEVAPVPSRLS